MQFYKIKTWKKYISIISLFIISSKVKAESLPIISAEGGTHITQCENGQLLIDIQPVNQQGLSHNKYIHFNVNKEGLLIHNETVKANIILNEVISENISSLNGLIEIKGKQADFILANPNGIICNGCGFINITSGILIAGKPLFDNNLLTGFDIHKGNIQIKENGLIVYKSNNIDIRKIHLIGSRITINGKIKGERYDSQEEDHLIDNVNIVSGSIKIKSSLNNASTSFESHLKSEDAKIDAGDLGSIYAKKIYLYNNGFGIGVNSKLFINNADELIITTNGDLILNSNINVNNYIEIKNAESVTNLGQLNAHQNIFINNIHKLTNGDDSKNTIAKHASIKSNHIKISSSLIDNQGIIESKTSNVINYYELKNQENAKIISIEGDNLFNETQAQVSTFINHGKIFSEGNTLINSTQFKNDIFDREKFQEDNLPTIYANKNLKIKISHGRNFGGILFSKENLEINKLGTERTVFDNIALFEYQDVYKKFSTSTDVVLVDRYVSNQLGGVLFSKLDMTINVDNLSNQGPLFNCKLVEKCIHLSGEIHAVGNVNIFTENFKNIGGIVNAKKINIQSSKSFNNLSGRIYGKENNIKTNHFIHTTFLKDNTNSEDKDYVNFRGHIGSIEGTHNNSIFSSGNLFILGAKLISEGDLNIAAKEQIKVSSIALESKISNQEIENKVEDSFIKIYTSKSNKKNKSLIQEAIFPLLKANEKITVESDSSIEIAGAKFYSDKSIFIKSINKDIIFNPFYLTKSVYTEDNLFRDVKILFGITTWDEKKLSINSILEINHLTTEIFFRNKLSINAPIGEINIGEVDFATLKDRKSGKSSIEISAMQITSNFDKIKKQSVSNTDEIFFGIQSEKHSSITEALNHVSKKLEVKGGSQAYVKASILKGGQILGDIGNLTLGDSLGGSISLLNEITHSESKNNLLSDGFSILYADDIFIHSNHGDIELKGVDLVSDLSDGIIELKSKNNIRLSESANTLKWDINISNERFSLEAFANSNLFVGSAGAGIRGGYDHGNKENHFSNAYFYPFNISAKNISLNASKNILMRGGKITAGHISFVVGENLKIQTMQDTTFEKTAEESWGGSLGIDLNTYTEFGINFDLHGSKGNTNGNSALTTQQTGILSKKITGKVAKDLELIGAYLIGNDSSNTLIVDGKIYANTLEDINNKEGFVVGGGIGIGVDGRPIGNINYSSPDLMNYKATQFSTISGIEIKNSAEIIGNLNKNKDELMTIKRNDFIGNMDIKGIFSFFSSTKPKKIAKQRDKNLGVQKNKKENLKLTPHQIYTYATSLPKSNVLENTNSPFQIKEKFYIKIDHHSFEVKFDKDNSTWRIVSPLYGFLKPSIPVIYENGKWEMHSNVGLRGGGDEKSKSNNLEDIEKASAAEKIISTRNNEDFSNKNNSTNKQYISKPSNAFLQLSTAKEMGYVSDHTNIKSVDEKTFELFKIGEEINRFVRDTLPLGAGNQKHDVLMSQGLSLLRTNVSREIKGMFLPRYPSQPYRDHVRIIQAACSGNCGEHAEMAYHYAVYKYNDHINIKKVSDKEGEHSFIVIHHNDDLGIRKTVVVDPWTIHGGVHLLEDYKCNIGEITKDNRQHKPKKIELGKKTKSQEDFSRLFEDYLKDIQLATPDLLNSIVSTAQDSNPEDLKHDRNMWNQSLLLKNENLIYKTEYGDDVFIPFLADPQRNSKLKSKVDTLLVH